MARPKKDLCALCLELHTYVANALAELEDFLFSWQHS